MAPEMKVDNDILPKVAITLPCFPMIGTMIVMLDANPGIVAACHVGQLLFLSVLILSLLVRSAHRMYDMNYG